MLIGMNKPQIITSTSDVTGTIFSVTLNTNGSNIAVATRRNVVTPTNVPTFNPTQARITVRGSTLGSCSISKTYIGHKAASGDAYDFASTPTQILWSGSAALTATASSVNVSDWCNFAWNKTSDIVVSMFFDNASVDAFRYVATGSVYSLTTTDEADVVDASSGWAFVARTYMLSDIETDGF